MIRFLILSGYFELMMYLQLTGKLNQYINTHYSYLAVLSAILSLILAIVQLINWMRRTTHDSHGLTRSAKVISIILLALPLLSSVAIPSKTLDATIVSAKGFNFPLAEGSGDSSDGTQIQYLQPNTSLYFTKSAYDKIMKKELAKYEDKSDITITTANYMEIMELIYNFPGTFEGKTVSYSGFVYNDPTDTSAQFLFRFGIIHCIADSGVFGLRTLSDGSSYPNNTWIKITGQIQMAYYAPFKREIPIVKPEHIAKIQKPENPYVYRTF
ncbi:TIGR03943 family putative permease subunit [Lactococcus insecticola]|uniref:Phosphate ABC transporter substrate-binding protein n=1 Tax=Pseudolactococcus insecticola TaxID=2709158 RepID=A0A6A0B807_9LACT|nr:TIGR03943 family protein [Lactococcus insecticola]GFH40925.1 phosphate ABC transporter substrate-binding protein [Lactococcus insecticola]